MSNVPRLRFKEFSGEWAEKLLGDLADIKTGNKDTQDRVEEGLYPFFVRSQTIERINSYSFDGEAILTAGDGVGVGKVFHYLNEKFDYHQRVYNIHNFKDNVIGKYIFFYFAERFYRRVIRLSAKNSVDSVRKEMISKMEIPLPSKQEQEKIASFLTSVDTKIEQLTKKEELLSSYKKGVMQKIFSGEIRFKADDGSEFAPWEEKKLGDVSYITTGKSNREDSGTEGQYAFFDRSEDIRTSDIFLFDKEAIIIAGEGSDFPPKYFKGKFDLHQRTYAIMDFVNTEAKYLFFYLHYYRNYFVRYAVGSTVKSLRLPIFQKMDIKLPCLEEQTKIANLLSSLDAKVEQVQKQLDSTKEFKKALLQQMFV